MILPGGDFNTRREAAGNHITHRCAIDTGNLALLSKLATASASSTFSADWPASGAIDGDRTHINAGAASAAENGVGQSVWRGSVVSDGSGVLTPNENIVIDLGAVKSMNRIKLIFWPAKTNRDTLGAVAPKDFLIEGWDGGGGGYVHWSGLADKTGEIGKGAVSISSGQVTGNTNDMVVFEDSSVQSFRYVRVTVSKLQAASQTVRLIAAEITLAVDVTGSVMASSRTRKKDYHLNRRIASELTVSLLNFDKKFSDRHVPTSAETTIGFFNASIRPNLEIRYFSGFSGVNSQMFSGYIDAWTPDSLTRMVNVKARDFFKFFIKPKITTNLKTNQSLEYLVEFVANLQNFPSNMMKLDTTTISPAYFMPQGQVVQDILNSLMDATGDAEIYFDEFGQLHFRSYLNVISHQWATQAAADWQAGTGTQFDATTTPGQLLIANVAGTYYTEANWFSALSPVLSGKVQFTKFVAAVNAGPSGAVDIFLRVTNDGGSTYTPWRPILPYTDGTDGRGLLSKWNHYFSQIQIWVRLRTSNTAATPSIQSAIVKYQSRGGSAMVATTPDWSIKDTGTGLGMRRNFTDAVGGANYMIGQMTVKSNPRFLAAGAVDAWQGTVNKAPVSSSNPLIVPVGVTKIAVDFGGTAYNVPQTVVLTLGTATASASISNHPTAPTVTITTTVAGTITGLKVQGTPFLQTGTVQAVALASKQVQDDYGQNLDELDNDYIDNPDQALDIALAAINKFGQGPLDWIQELPLQFSPNAQINDRVTVVDSFSEVNDDYVAIGYQDDLSISGKTLAASTRAELVKIGKNGFVSTVAAYFGSAGKAYYSAFRFGGDKSL